MEVPGVRSLKTGRCWMRRCRGRWMRRCGIRSWPRRGATRWRCWSCRAACRRVSWRAGSGCPARCRWTPGSRTVPTAAERLPEQTRRLVLLAAADPSGDASLVWRTAGRLGIPVQAAGPTVESGLAEFAGRVRFRHSGAVGSLPVGVAAGKTRDAWRAGGGDRCAGRSGSPGLAPGGAVRRHHFAVLTVDRVDDAGHRLAYQQAAGHPQWVIGWCCLACPPSVDGERPVDGVGGFLERQQDLAGRS